jgi:hypothetical protein
VVDRRGCIGRTGCRGPTGWRRRLQPMRPGSLGEVFEKSYQMPKKSSLDLTSRRGRLRIPVPATELVGAMSTNDQCMSEPVTIRPATRADLPAIASLAELDSARVPRGRVLLAEVRGTVVAAISIESGALFADPFVPTAEVVTDLRAKAVEVRLADDPDSGRRATSLMARVREVRRRRQAGLRTTS